MDTDDLMDDVYRAIMIEAEKFNHCLTIQFGLLSSECEDDSDFIKQSLLLLNELEEADVEELFDDVFFGESFSKKHFDNTIAKIRNNIQHLDVFKADEAPFPVSSPLINKLFHIDGQLQENLIEQIVALPREALIKDLVYCVDYGIKHIEIYKDTRDDLSSNFVLHALFLLEEIKAPEGLHATLKMLAQEEDVTEFWLGDHTNATMWQNIFSLGQRQLDLLYEFIIDEQHFLFHRTVICDGVAQMYIHVPALQKEVTEWFHKLLNHVSQLENKPDNQEFNGFVLACILDFKDLSLLPVIENLHERNMIDTSICGELEDVLAIMHEKSKTDKHEILSITERYFKSDTDYSDLITGKKIKERREDLYDFIEKNIPITRESPKIGRNDTCPCGSGKKYKKCHLSIDEKM